MRKDQQKNKINAMLIHYETNKDMRNSISHAVYIQTLLLICYFIIKMIRLLSISRTGSFIISMNDLFLSISTGLLLILHYIYFVPLITSEDNDYSLYSILYSLLFVTALKLLFQGIFTYFSNKKEAKENDQARQIPFRKLIYSAAIKITAYLCIIFLLITINGITFSLTVFLTCLFIFSLQYCSKNDRIIKILWKGRSLGSNRVKTFIIGILVLGSILLQPLTYGFIFQLHFQIFIIFTGSLMFFSYFYLHKLLLTVSPKDYVPKIMTQVGSLQCLFIGFLIIYYKLMQQNGLTFSDQLTYIADNILILLGTLILSFVYEVVLIQTLKKVAVNRLIITQITGILWFNIYVMSKEQIQLKHYISVIIMLFILLVNIELFSEDNIRSLLNLFSNNKKKKKKTTFTQMEMKQSENDH